MSKKAHPKTIFATTDYWGNEVVLSENTWNQHIVIEHPEMAGYEQTVEKIVSDPYEVRPSTLVNTSLAFISDAAIGPRPAGVRVLVTYDDVHYQKGASTGKIATAYPIDIIKYAYPQLGSPIYKKKGGK